MWWSSLRRPQRTGPRCRTLWCIARICAYDGSNPTLLTAYGGFQIANTPSYSPVNGKLWLEHGGVYVLANIRGGGEFGPAWHEAGLKTHRQRIYDDFYAVAEDLVTRKITSSRRLGIRWRVEWRPADGRGIHPAPGDVECGSDPGAAAGHVGL